MFKKMEKYILIIITSVITILGILVQLAKVFWPDYVIKFEISVNELAYLGQAYTAIGSAVLGSELASKFGKCGHCARRYCGPFLWGGLIVTVCFIWFSTDLESPCNKQEIINILVPVILGMLTGVLYEVFVQRERKSEKNSHG